MSMKTRQKVEKLRSEGKTYQEIADTLGLASISTVHYHLIGEREKKQDKFKNKAIAITARLDREILKGRFSSSTLENVERVILEELLELEKGV